MPNAAEIETIKRDFAQCYEIDLPNVRNDQLVKLHAFFDSTKNQLADSKEVYSAQIYNDASTYTYQGSSAFVPDLETRTLAEIKKDDRLFPQRIELNLDEAMKYLQNCHQIRKEYGESAKLRNDTRFKGEEFIRLDLVHLEEVKAGLYKLPWQEAADERTALESAIRESERQYSVVKEVAAALSDDRSKKYVADVVELARLSANAFKPDIAAKTTDTTQFRTNIEKSTWQQTLAAVAASIAQHKGKHASIMRKEIYLRQDEMFRAHRAAISRQLAMLQLREHCRPRSALNYNETMIHQKTLFDMNLVYLVERVVALEVGLKDCYGIELPLGAPETGNILNRISEWLGQVQNELSKYKRSQRISVLSLSTTKPLNIKPRVNSTSLDTFEADLLIDDSLVGAKKALLRGVALEYFGRQQRPISITVEPPEGAYTGFRAPVLFGRVVSFEPALDLKPQHSDLFWNGSALGTWKIEGTFDQQAGDVEGVMMHLWIASF